MNNSRLHGSETLYARPWQALGDCPALARTGHVTLNWGTEIRRTVLSGAGQIDPVNAHCARNNVYGCETAVFEGSKPYKTDEASWALKGFSNRGTAEDTAPRWVNHFPRKHQSGTTRGVVFVNENQVYPGVWTPMSESEKMVLTWSNNTIRAVWWMARPFSSP